MFDLMIRIALNIIRKRLGAGHGLEGAAESIEVLEPETREHVPPLLVLPGMLDRVTSGVPGHSTAAEELSAATLETFDHAPLIRYVLKDALVHLGGVEYRGGYLPKSSAFRDRLVAGPSRKVHEATYCMSRVSHDYFGHWLSDACPTALLAAGNSSEILDARPDWPDAADYALAFGLTTRPASTLRVERLEVYQDFAQGSSKRARYAELKARLRDHVGTSVAPSGPVYLRRGSTGSARTIAHEAKLCEALEARGFDIVDLATTPFRDRYRRLAAATILVTVDGSHTNHAFFAMSPGTAVISLSPADRFTMRERGVANAMGLRYGCLVVQPSMAGYQVDLGEVLRTFDLAMRAEPPAT